MKNKLEIHGRKKHRKNTGYTDSDEIDQYKSYC